MVEQDFNLIMSSLEDRIDLCREHIGKIRNTADISELKICDAVRMKDFCMVEEPIMTKIAMVDLYHLIGMGDLTPPQMMKFTYKLKEYLNFRPIIKAIVNHLDSISQLPKLPVATQYKLMGLCDLTLVKGTGDIIDDAEISDYDQAKRDSGAPDPYSADLPFKLSGKTLTLDVNYSEQFAAILSKIFKTNLSEKNLMAKISSRHSYAGIDWISFSGSTATGLVTAENNYKKLKSYYDDKVSE